MTGPTARDELLASLDEDDVMYDHPVAMSGEPMDPVLFVRWDAIAAALAAARSEAPGAAARLHEAIGTSDESTGLEHWHSASGGRTPGERAGVYVDRQQVHDLIDEVLG